MMNEIELFNIESHEDDRAFLKQLDDQYEFDEFLEREFNFSADIDVINKTIFLD